MKAFWEILKIPLPCSSFRDDCRIWIKNQNGKFTIKTAYHLVAKIGNALQVNFPNIAVEKIWKLEVHDHHKLLLWKILWDIIPTKGRLKSFLPSLPSFSCPLCNEQQETLLYLFLECPISRILWSQSKWPLNLSSLAIATIQDWISFILNPKLKLGLSSQEVHPFQLFAILMLDFTWRLRNDIVHNQKVLSLWKAVEQLGFSY